MGYQVCVRCRKGPWSCNDDGLCATCAAEPAEHETAWHLDDVQDWRLCQLVQAGADFLTALELAVRTDVDLHVACDMLAAGCEPDTLRNILT